MLNPATKELLIGALKSGVGSLCALIVALPMVDPLKFSLASLGGWNHILQVTGAVVVVSEARYWAKWAAS